MAENLNFDSFVGLKWPKNFAFGAYILHTYQVAPKSLQIKFRMNPVETFQGNGRKPIN